MNRSSVSTTKASKKNITNQKYYRPRVFGTSITNLPEFACVTRKNSKSSLENLLNDYKKNTSFNIECDNRGRKPIRLVIRRNLSKPNPLAEYKNSIIVYLYQREKLFDNSLDYLRIQPDITERMREILLDWLVQVHLKFKLLSETLFLAVNVIDRYLAKAVVPRQKLQLVGVTAMFIACKYEETCSPKAKDFAFITDNSYSKSDILDMEYRILKALDCALTIPSSYRFLQILFAPSDLPKTRFMAQYILELCMMKYEMLKYKNSLLANAAMGLAKRLIERNKDWDKINEKYKEKELKIVMKEMIRVIKEAEINTLQGVKQKFAQPKYMQISHITVKKKPTS